MSEKRRRQPRAPRPAETPEDDGLQPLYTDVAGIDVGSKAHFVSVPPDRDPEPVRTFGCLTPELYQMADWLTQCGIRRVALESTGVYWIPIFRVLEERGFEVTLVDARRSRHVPGRKTDVVDCQWLRRLHTYGLLSPCFVPPAEVAELREYWRHRGTLVESCAQCIHRMQKALEQMNLQLHKVLSDITGTTGLQILRAIVAGEQDPAKLAGMPHAKLKVDDETLAAALTGYYRPEHLFTLRQALAAYDFFQGQLAQLDEVLQACLAHFETPPERSVPATPPPEKRRKNQPGFDLRAEMARILGVDTCKIDGIQAITAQQVVAETGPDLSRWSHEKRFGSWLRICPNPEVTGGKARRGKKRPPNRAGQAFKVAAMSLERSDSANGAFYRRMKALHGPAVAVKATAYRLARLFYRCVRYGEEYVDQGQLAYEAQQRHRREAALARNAKALGFTLIPTAAAELVS
jgi:transposase